MKIQICILIFFQLNVFHWHIVDSHSIPIDFSWTGDEDLIAMTQYGVYDANSMYTKEDIDEIVEHANRRGN